MPGMLGQDLREAATATAGSPPAELSFLLAQDLLRCPVDGSALTFNEHAGRLEGTGGCHSFPVEAGIPLLFAPNEWPAGKTDVTAIVQQFYEETPFPNYDGLDSRDSLRRKARDGVLARLLDEQIRTMPRCWRPAAAPASSPTFSAWAGAAPSSVPTSA
jgi:hypothetical protein